MLTHQGDLPKLNAVIIDDEPPSHEAIRRKLDQSPFPVEIIASGYNIKDGLRIFGQIKPDILFLDIEMPDGLGFTLLEQIDQPDLSVVFISAHPGYAIQAVKFGALDYLLKPFTTEQFEEVLERIFKQKQKEHKEKQLEDQLKIALEAFQKLQARELPSKFGIPTTDGILYKKIQDIIHLKGNKNYTDFSLLGEQKIIIASKNIGEYVTQLADYPNFMRVHRSNLINLEYVEKYLRAKGGSVVMRDGTVIRVSKKYREKLLDRLATV